MRLRIAKTIFVVEPVLKIMNVEPDGVQMDQLINVFLFAKIRSLISNVTGMI